PCANRPLARGSGSTTCGDFKPGASSARRILGRSTPFPRSPRTGWSSSLRREPMHPEPRFDARDAARDGEELGPLPEWDLSALYAGPDDPALARDMDQVAAEAAAFAERYEGKLADLDAAGFLECIRAY